MLLEMAVVMFWNLENYFDPFDDPSTLDDEFTSKGEKHWTWRRFERKRNGIAKVIVAAGRYGEIPSIVAFAEVENKMVLRQLLKETPLEKMNWDIIHRDSPDPRGIDVGLIFRKDRFKPIEVRTLTVSEEFRTRDILYVKGIFLRNGNGDGSSGGGIGEANIRSGTGGITGRSESVTTGGSECTPGGDTVHIFVNHWPSKRGGAEVSGPKRLAAATVLSGFVDSLLSTAPGQRVIALGDFNDVPGNISLPLFNLSAEAAARGEGTLKYRGNWEMIDQCFISDTAGCDMSVFRPEFLLEPDRTYTGFKPRRTYVGPAFHGGLSDHLPIIAIIRE